MDTAGLTFTNKDDETTSINSHLFTNSTVHKALLLQELSKAKG